MLGLKKKIIFLITFLSFTSTFAQLEDALEVETRIKRLSDTEYLLIFDYFIEEDWHLYCQHNPEGASEPLQITATDEGQKDFKFLKHKNGDAYKETKHKKEFSEDFEVDQTFFHDEATVKQKIKLLNPDVKLIKITVIGQACNESCVPYEQEFQFKIKKKKKSEKEKEKEKEKSEEKKEEKKEKESIDKKILIGAGAGVLLLILILFFVFRKKKD